MSSLTFDELKLILFECAGQDDQAANLDPETIDTPFADLGYDSLAVLEAAAVAGRLHHVAIADDDVQAIRTPREFLDTVNGARPVNTAVSTGEVAT